MFSSIHVSAHLMKRLLMTTHHSHFLCQARLLRSEWIGAYCNSIADTSNLLGRDNANPICPVPETDAKLQEF
jgi:hypothetical protein